MKTDMTFCLGNGCEVRDTCYRYTQGMKLKMLRVAACDGSWMDTPNEKPCPEKLEVKDDKTRD